MCKRIGITGGSGSGKGYICAMLTKKGFPCIDTDGIVHTLYSQNEACLNELKHEFGEDVFENGSLVRSRLASVVFSDPRKLQILNKIVHKYVVKECDRICNEYFRLGHKAVFIDAPQLYEAGMDKDLDGVIAVVAPIEIRINRILHRDSINEDQAKKRIANQHTDDFFINNADFVIQNGYESDAELEVRLKEILSVLEL